MDVCLFGDIDVHHYQCHLESFGQENLVLNHLQQSSDAVQIYVNSKEWS